MTSYRLQTLAGFYSHHTSVWDIGCDHGLLGTSFLNHPKAKEIHLVDPSSDVINVLKKNLIDSYITIPDSVFIHHQTGQEITLGPEKKIVFIAGMGGKEIKAIIEHFTPQMGPDDRLVISPHRYVFELRQFLSDSEWRLHTEVLVQENQQYYQILCLEKSLSLPRVHPFGLSLWTGPEGREYSEHVMKYFCHHKDALSMSLLAYLKQLSY